MFKIQEIRTAVYITRLSSHMQVVVHHNIFLRESPK